MSIDIAITVIEYEKIDKLYNNYLKLKFSGTYINFTIINTIRRTILELLPTYAYDLDDIHISNTSTSIYNKDDLKGRLCSIPIFGIENNRTVLDKVLELEYETTITIYDNHIEDINLIEEKLKEKRLEKSKNFIMNIDVKNTTNDILNVTTNHKNVTFMYKTEIINSPYESELLLIKLKPGQEFKCEAISSLNIPLKHTSFMSTAVCVFEEIDKTTYILYIESLKQIEEKEIIIRACMIIEIKLNELKYLIINKIKEIKDTDSEFLSSGTITLEHENYTYGELLSLLLQTNTNIKSAGIHFETMFKKEIKIKYETINNTSIIDIIEEVIKKGILIYKTIIYKLEKLNIK